MEKWNKKGKKWKMLEPENNIRAPKSFFFFLKKKKLNILKIIVRVTTYDVKATLLLSLFS